MNYNKEKIPADYQYLINLLSVNTRKLLLKEINNSITHTHTTTHTFQEFQYKLGDAVLSLLDSSSPLISTDFSFLFQLFLGLSKNIPEYQSKIADIKKKFSNEAIVKIVSAKDFLYSKQFEKGEKTVFEVLNISSSKEFLPSFTAINISVHSFLIYGEALEVLCLSSDFGIKTKELAFRLSIYQKFLSKFSEYLKTNELTNLKACTTLLNKYKVSYLINKGWYFHRLQHLDKALALWDENKDLFISLPIRSILAAVYNLFGTVATDYGNLDLSIDFFDKSIHLAKEIADKDAEMAALSNQTLNYRKQGQVDKAIAALHQVYLHYLAKQQFYKVIVTGMQLLELVVNKSEWKEETIVIYNKLKDILVQDEKTLPNRLAFLALIATHLDKYDESNYILDLAKKRAEDIEDKSFQFWLTLYEGLIELKILNLSTACSLLNSSLMEANQHEMYSLSYSIFTTYLRALLLRAHLGHYSTLKKEIKKHAKMFSLLAENLTSKYYKFITEVYIAFCNLFLKNFELEPSYFESKLKKIREKTELTNKSIEISHYLIKKYKELYIDLKKLDKKSTRPAFLHKIINYFRKTQQKEVLIQSLPERVLREKILSCLSLVEQTLSTADIKLDIQKTNVYMVMLLSNAGIPYFSKKILESNLDDILISGLLSAIKSFSKQMFGSTGIFSITQDKYTLALYSLKANLTLMIVTDEYSYQISSQLEQLAKWLNQSEIIEHIKKYPDESLSNFEEYENLLNNKITAIFEIK